MGVHQDVGRLEVGGVSLPARRALIDAIDEAWERLRQPGTWWTGAERLAIAAEVRASQGCSLCRDRKAALSPYQVNGAHDAAHNLPEAAVEAIHRLATDAGRVTRKWVRAICEGALGEERYVEIVSIVAIVTALDTLDGALGRPVRSLPLALPGEPTRKRPAGARLDIAWVATLDPNVMQQGDLNPFVIHGDKNIHRGVSLVPQEVMNFFDLDVHLYLQDHEIRDFENDYRAISHAQIELIAARASAINDCFY